MGVEHGLDPYLTAPQAIRGDPVVRYAGSKDATSVYGPVFTLGTYLLVPLGVAGAFWALKALAAAGSLAIVGLVFLASRRRGVDPRRAIVAVGLNPTVLVHVVGGAHNEALVVLGTVAGVVAWTRGSRTGGAALAAAAATLKASAVLVVPYLLLGARDRSCRLPQRGPVMAAFAVLALTGLSSVMAFGPEALDAFSVLGANQGRTSSYAFPRKTAELLALLGPGERLAYQGPVRLAYAGTGVLVLAWLAWLSWRGLDPVEAAGWATVTVLVASAWLVPWYVLWLLPLAALAGDRRLLGAAVALTAWTLPVAIPW
jgi:alpha-1,6-mannosyltransferase